MYVCGSIWSPRHTLWYDIPSFSITCACTTTTHLRQRSHPRQAVHSPKVSSRFTRGMPKANNTPSLYPWLVALSPDPQSPEGEELRCLSRVRVWCSAWISLIIDIEQVVEHWESASWNHQAARGCHDLGHLAEAWWWGYSVYGSDILTNVLSMVLFFSFPSPSWHQSISVPWNLQQVQQGHYL